MVGAAAGQKVTMPRISAAQLEELRARGIRPIDPLAGRDGDDEEAAPAKRHKYGVAPSQARRWRGKVYDSRAEMLYAKDVLDPMVVAREIVVFEQVRIWLGVPENVCVIDFLVIPLNDWQRPYFVDVKGVKTAAFKRNVRLWKRYGPLDLHIVKREGGYFETVEIVSREGS